MKDNLILLADLLANDDNFAADFSSRKFADDKFKLAKARLKNLEKEEFTEFLESLQSLEKIDQKLPLDKLQNVSGGVGGYKTKLAALAFLGLALTPLASMGTEIVSANFPKFYQDMYTDDELNILKSCQGIVDKIKNLKIPDFYIKPKKPKPQTDFFKINLDTIRDLYKKLAKVENDSFTKYLSNLGPETLDSKIKDLNISNYVEEEFYKTDLGKKYKELDNRRLYYVNIYNEVIKKTIENDTFFEENKKSLNGFDRLILKTNLGDYTISKPAYNHIIYGEYSYNYAALQDGGHSSKARQLLKKIYSEKAEKDTDTNRKNKFIEEVIKNEENLPEDEKGSVTKDGQRKSTSKIGIKKYHLTDSSNAVPNEGQDAPPYNYYGHTFFPKEWDERAIINAIKACIENDDITIDPKTGKKTNETRNLNDELTYNFHAMINDIPMRVVTGKKNEIKTAFPLIDVHKYQREFYAGSKKLNSVNIDLSADPFEILTTPLNNNDNNNELTTSPETPSNGNDVVQYRKRNTISKNEANAINKRRNESGTIQTQKNKFAVFNESSDDEEYYETEIEGNNDNLNLEPSSNGSESGKSASSNDFSENEHSYGAESDSSDGSNSKNVNDSTKSQAEKEQSSTGFSFKNLISKLWPF